MRLTFMVFRVGIQVYDWMFPVKYSPISNHHISAAKLPWLFIGIELKDGSIVDKTSHVQDLIKSGIPITVENVCMFVDIHTVKRCFYLDEKTLKEEEIPANGITINDS
jgi:hypothetical protein